MQSGGKYGTNQKSMQILSLSRQVYAIQIGQENQANKNCELSFEKPIKNEQTIQNSIIKQLEEKIKIVQEQLFKQQEFSFILKQYFHKIEQFMYHQSTNILDQHPLNYEQLELHLREILRRLQDVHNQRLTAPPKIYKKNNTKVYKVIPSNSEK